MSVTTFTVVGGQMMRQVKDGIVHDFVPDPLGSVVMVQDSAGAAVYKAEYDPYGNVQSETGTNPSSLGYVGTLGYIKDSATSMYVRARYLLNNLGRWLTKDPLWPIEPGYIYVGGIPNMLVDPSGHSPVIPQCTEANVRFAYYTCLAQGRQFKGCSLVPEFEFDCGGVSITLYRVEAECGKPLQRGCEPPPPPLIQDHPSGHFHYFKGLKCCCMGHHTHIIIHYRTPYPECRVFGDRVDGACLAPCVAGGCPKP